MTDLLAPLQSLKQGNWFKLICGASYQHLPAVRNLTLAYTLAGADCVDVAADPAVIAATQEALLVAQSLVDDAQKRGFAFTGNLPLLMVSLNDGEDPHFRKAEFNDQDCPSDCSRPCEKICPAQAILFNNTKDDFSGVISEKCYGCGRCLPICPYGIIYTKSYVSTPGAIAPLIMSTGIEAVEIHTQVGRLAEFQRLWDAMTPWADKLKLVAISCNDGEGLIDYLQAIYNLIVPRPQFLIWQTDGRSMSGDIGDGTTIATIKLGQKVLTANLPGYVQLAGGTNSYTVPKLRGMGLLNDFRLPILDFGLEEHNLKSKIQNPKSKIAGVGYGSYARVLLSPILDQLENKEVINTDSQGNIPLEEEPELLWEAVRLAHTLVSQIKSGQ
ncbi:MULTISPECIES: circadian clock protein LdpA [Nostocales]|uniref:4Fe-4S ferredoxin n=2 Tax=Aphanizomenonaceae TaxID=1892259 RepID=A0ACC7S3N1_DOLFA|nr:MULTISPECIES: LdpA C-terminal domain-containing domain [Nostocales]MBD2278034.1 4Fe-4S binding protein [Aphanizomenon flos-aquae FACHB-1040]MBO1068773.1 4Fe-4S binding protein [Dolichospermum sp. DEX189]MBO1066015.1 4Fe-4S binding protein [Anabaena sp. 54]MTJ43108.1 4Fe-4S ferredoxin [Dolichospermum flos-aquae UHCC 0037]OBQ16211.1 MAG: 4Fe-4S ferredoxin [Anabaena sp. AL93]